MGGLTVLRVFTISSIVLPSLRWTGLPLCTIPFELGVPDCPKNSSSLTQTPLDTRLRFLLGFFFEFVIWKNQVYRTRVAKHWTAWFCQTLRGNVN